MVEALAVLCAVLASVPIVTTLVNLPLFRRLPPLGSDVEPPPVSLLVPARDEQDTIGRLIESALANAGTFEIVVLDDHSTDRTAAVVRDWAARDSRVRLETAPPLPPGWSGKQHACHCLAAHARHDIMVFVDADLVLGPDALARIGAAVDAEGPDLLSGFPRQVTGTLGEKLTVPNIMVLLLGYLPLAGERFTRQPGFAAGCGQLLAARRDAYERAGGHGAVRASLHEGIRLPRVFRRAGLRTRLFDAGDLASCRMYRSFAEAWAGFAKNATEGMATPLGLPVWTALLAGGHLLPWLVLAAALWQGPDAADATWLAAGALVALYVWRLVVELRVRGSAVAVLLYPLGVALMLAIQWDAFLRRRRGQPAAWRGRTYPAE